MPLSEEVIMVESANKPYHLSHQSTIFLLGAPELISSVFKGAIL
jgi:hypothetical protein